MVDDEEGDVVGTAVREVINILYFKPFGVIMLRLYPFLFFSFAQCLCYL